MEKKEKRQKKTAEKKGGKKGKEGPKGYTQKLIFHKRTVKRNRNEIEAQKKLRF